MHSTRSAAVALLLTLVTAAGRGFADDACIDFKWDVTRERALFAGPPSVLPAGKDSKSAPPMVPDRLYKLELAARDQVAFSVAPATKTADSNGFAGLASLKITTAGSYRIAVDLPVWIDVASSGHLVAARDFEGQHSCAAPHKIVEFDLAGLQSYVLQFSNAASSKILLTVTQSPARRL